MDQNKRMFDYLMSKTKISKISQASTPKSYKKKNSSSSIKEKSQNHVYANIIIKEQNPQQAANKQAAETSTLDNQPVTSSEIGYENFCKRIQNPSSTQLSLFDDDDDLIEYVDPAENSSYQIENSFSRDISAPGKRQCE